MYKINKLAFLIFVVILAFLASGYLRANALKGQSTEDIHNAQVQKDDEILAKDYKDLTKEELKRYNQIQKAQEPHYSLYQKRLGKKLANSQPKTYSDYEQMSSELKNPELQDFNPQFKKDSYYEKVPEPEVQVVRYNYPAGSKEINLSALKTTRSAKSIGVLSPDNTKVAYSDVNYDAANHKTSSNVYVIPVTPYETKAQKRANYIRGKETELANLNQEIINNKSLQSFEISAKKKEIKKLKKEIEQLKKASAQQDLNDSKAMQNDTPAQIAAKALMQAHIKDKEKKPILSSGVYDMDYGIQRTLTIVDWSLNSKRVLIKEKIAKEGNGLWETNIWVYDFETGKAKKLDEVRQAIEYYWNKNQLVDLYYYRFDIYPLGWDAQHSDRILLYAYGYNKNNTASPKFLGTWSIDYKGEQSHLVSVMKTGYVVQANGFSLKTKNIEYYEK